MIHSMLSGVCNGMCGLIEKGADAQPPDSEVTQPDQDEVIVRADVPVPVTIAGTANDNVAVTGVRLRIFNMLGDPSDHPAVCTGCPGASVTWSATVYLLPGQYLAEARPIDAKGSTRASAPRRFLVV